MHIFKKTAESKKIRMTYELINFPFLPENEDSSPRHQII
jgi:hypothetical protein